MKKRGNFSSALLATLLFILTAAAVAAQDYTDIGSAYELVVQSQALAEAETNTSSTVTIITREQIDRLNCETTAELVNTAIGTTFSSYGALGAQQQVQIRGASASKTLIYLNGVLLTSAHEGVIDLSIIPVSSIDHIEIVRSGPGNLGKTSAIGGMVNIITRKGIETDTPFTLSFENGSFLPQAYGTEDNRNWLGLLDSQKLDLSYADSSNGLSVAANLGGILAQNGYTYETETGRDIRENSGMHNIHGSADIDGTIGEHLGISSSNLVSYQHVGVPGGLTFGLTPDDYQEDLLLTTNNTFTLTGTSDVFEHLKASVNYSYGRTFFHDEDSVDSTHGKHKANAQFEQEWNLDEDYALTTGLDAIIDYVDSTDVGEHTRVTPSLYAAGGMYLADGLVSLHPSANIAYLSDTEAFSPNASVGAIYNLSDETILKGTVSYAENVPTFSQLYWPYMGNENLETEKGLNGDIGVTYETDTLSYEGAVFARDIYNDITYNSSWIPQNIAHSAYFGTEQSVIWHLNAALSLGASYQYNKSYDLSDGQSLSDNVEVATVRKHTAQASVSYETGDISATLGGQYLGKTTYTDSIFLVNASANARVSDDFKVHVAIDNLLNASYELASGYPMPGTKIRIGGDWIF